MKKLAFLLLLCVFSAFISDKNLNLENQLGSIQKEVLKWYQELNEFKKWAKENDGILDSAEKKIILDYKLQNIAILKRIKEIAHVKQLNMPFAAVAEKLLGRTIEKIEEEIETELKNPDNTDHIPQGSFIRNAKKALEKLSTINSGDTYEIESEILRYSLGKLAFTTPFGTEILQTVILKIPSGKITPSQLCKAISYAAKFWNKDQILLDHFNKYKADYLVKETTGEVIELEKIDLLKDVDLLYSFVENLKSSADEIKKEEEVKKKEEEVKKKEEEDAFEKFKAFFTAGMANEKDKIEAISTLGDTAFLDFRIMNVEMLHSNKREISSVAYSEGFKEYVVAGLIIFVKSKKLCSAAEAKVEAKKLLDDFCEENSLRELYRLYKQKKQHSYPSGFASWINQSTVSIDLKNFENHFKTAWADKAVSAVDSFQRELKSKGLNFKADRALLESNFKRILGVGIGKNNSQPGLEIHKTFMALIPADNILDYAVIDSFWEKTIAESVKPDFMNNLCSKYFIEGAENTYDIEEAINSIDSILPNIDAIAVELYNSRYYAKPLPKPKSENPLMIRVTINKVGREKQLMDLVLDIPLRFEVRKAKNNELLYHPVPSMDLSNVTVRNAFGFSVSAVQKVYVGKTIDDTKNGFLETKTDYCWRLTVIDTSEQTVIQEPKVGEMIMVDASMGKLTGLDEVGIDPLGFSVKFVGNENGHCDKILGKITLMGLPFVVGWGKEGAIGYFENPMAFKEAELQYKYGNQNLDLYISCQVNTFIGTDYSINVDTNKIKLGMQDGSFVPEGLNLHEKSSQVITIERPGKVE